MNKKLQDSLSTATRPFSASVGEHIGAEAGAKMVKSFYDAHPEQAYGHLIGREIIEKILAQPGCAGLSIHPAYNEENVRQLVFVGVDIDGQQILKYAVIGENGNIEIKDGLVADRIIIEDDAESTSSWSWF